MKLFLLSLLILLTVFLRFPGLDKVPPALFLDEVDVGYQAYSFLKTGKDYFGNFLPVSFHSFADFRAPLYIYSAVGTIAAFGMSGWGVRLPAAIFGFLGVICLYVLTEKLTKNYCFSLLSAFVLAILPWHVHYSRIGFEVSALFFLLCFGLFFFYKFIERKNFVSFLFCLVILSFGFYTYATARLFLPLLGLATLVIYKKEIFFLGWRKLFLAAFLVLIMLTPFIKDTFFGGGLQRFSYINIFYDSNLKLEIGRQRLIDSVHGKIQEVGMKPSAMSYVFHNKPLSWTIKIFSNIISSFSFNFLFISGDPNLRHNLGTMGVILWIFLPFLIFGLYKMFSSALGKEKSLFSRRESTFWLVFFLICPLPASITYDGGTHATRLFFFVLPLTFFISLGIWEFWQMIREKYLKTAVISATIVLVSLNFIYYLHQYYFHYPLISEREWHFGFKEGVLAIVKEEGNSYEKVILSKSYQPPLIFFLFWSKFKPEEFKAQNLQWVSNDWFEGNKFGKYYFGTIGTGFLDNYLPRQIKNKEVEKILILAGRNDFGGDLERDAPFVFKVVNKVYLPSKEPIMYLLRTKTIEEVNLVR